MLKNMAKVGKGHAVPSMVELSDRTETAARPPDTAPSSQSGGGEAASQDAGKVAGMSEDDLHKKLEAKGYTDRDARDEIIDRLRAKHPDDQKAQAEALNKDYIGRSDKTIKGLNENLGNSRRAKANGSTPLILFTLFGAVG